LEELHDIDGLDAEEIARVNGVITRTAEGWLQRRGVSMSWSPPWTPKTSTEVQEHDNNDMEKVA
jgi:hypothetical protein